MKLAEIDPVKGNIKTAEFDWTSLNDIN